MKKHTTTSIFLLFAAVLFAAPSNASADTIFVFRGNNDGTVAELTSGGTGSETFSLDSTSGLDEALATYTYTISNIDAAGDGTANDSLTATFQLDSVGGNVRFQDDGNFGVTGNGAGNLNNVLETLTYSLQSSSVTLGDGGTGSVTGGGFNQIQFAFLGTGETASLAGTSADGSITGTTAFDSVATFTVGHNDDGSNFRVGPASYEFEITTVAVPEPSAAMLVVAGLFGLSVRRRR